MLPFNFQHCDIECGKFPAPPDPRAGSGGGRFRNGLRNRTWDGGESEQSGLGPSRSGFQWPAARRIIRKDSRAFDFKTDAAAWESAIWTWPCSPVLRPASRSAGRSPDRTEKNSRHSISIPGAAGHTPSRSWHPRRRPPYLPEAGPGTPHVRILPQEVGNTRAQKPRYTWRLQHVYLITLRTYWSAQTPRIPWPPRSRMPSRLLLRIVETQLDDFSSKPDSGAIFVVLLMPAGAIETTSRGCTQVCICGVLAVRRFSQVRDPKMNFGLGLATSAPHHTPLDRFPSLARCPRLNGRHSRRITGWAILVQKLCSNRTSSPWSLLATPLHHNQLFR